MAAAGGIEGVPGMNEGDGITAVLAAQAFDESLGEEAGPARVQQMAARDAEPGADVIDFLAPGIGADGAAVFAEGVGADDHLVLDGLVGMLGMVEVHGVLWRDDPVGGGDAAVGGADSEAPG